MRDAGGPMTSGHEREGRFSENPIGSDAPRGKARSQRKASRDGNTFTPTEQHRKNELMRQFMRTGEGSGGRSAEYVNSPVWCGSCGRRMNPCPNCAPPWVDF